MKSTQIENTHKATQNIDQNTDTNNGEVKTPATLQDIHPKEPQAQSTKKELSQAEKPKQKILETDVNVMQEYRPDLTRQEGNVNNDDMPALNPDEFGNETYDPNNPDDVEVSIGEFIPVPEMEAESGDTEEAVSNNTIEEDPQQDPEQMLKDRGEIIFSEDKEIGEPISADKRENQVEDSVEAAEIGVYRSADQPN